MSGAETLEQWAARVAPTLDAAGWREAEREHDPRAGVLTREEANALLAYRDSVVAGLTPAQRRVVTEIARLVGFPAARQTQAALFRRGIVHRGDDGGLTDFGREVARCLEVRS